MYTSIIRSKEIINGILRIVVDFSQNDDSFSREFTTESAQNDQWLDNQCQVVIDNLDALKDFASTIEVE